MKSLVSTLLCVLLITCNILAQSYNERTLRVFKNIQNMNGYYNVELQITDNPFAASPSVNRINTIFMPKSIITLCYQNRSADEGDDRMAFLLSHEFAHIINKDYDYDRFFDPFKDKDITTADKKQKEKSADILAATIALSSGYSLAHFYHENNIIENIYRNSGIKDFSKPVNNYQSAIKRVAEIKKRETDLKSLLSLFELGLLTIITGGHDFDNSMIHISEKALNAFQTLTSFQTPAVYNNLGVINYLLAYSNYNKYAGMQTGLPLCKFSYFDPSIFVSGKLYIRESDKAHQTTSANEFFDRYKGYLKRADMYFQNAVSISDNLFYPAYLNKIISACMKCDTSDFYDAMLEIERFERKYSKVVLSNNQQSFLFNLKAIICFLNNDTTGSEKYFLKAIEKNKYFTPAYKNLNKLYTLQKTLKIKQLPQELYPEKDNPLLTFIKGVRTTCVKSNYNIKSKNIKHIPFGSNEEYTLSIAERDTMTVFSVMYPDGEYKSGFYELRKNSVTFNELYNAGINYLTYILGTPSNIYGTGTGSFYYYDFAGLIIKIDPDEKIEKIYFYSTK